ncbi:hypothetical protein G4G28_03410 [Massilia sp. Dwa41.01b]|uniref:hypothetical protein n=1 Tax=Massilia sp. Dwa41.01b TaxID=2709302 RepID=UPI00160219FE|nr:hypothetical protein [Massilia sp. Dwa41.01b]QNA87748.1 hypothetical protein G4G28_03410 [Massilia sp. Dwa41.01b]
MSRLCTSAAAASASFQRTGAAGPKERSPHMRGLARAAFTRPRISRPTSCWPGSVTGGSGRASTIVHSSPRRLVPTSVKLASSRARQ